ncbi:MAG: CHC2 zinc finger domain-containing protein, partial [Tannerellaceae bacterium]|nr:CHC2 zinc finger domain-containing protein [Tannerellaceae bacterium]
MQTNIQKIKESNDISRIIGRYVTLMRKGSKLTGLCPFHDDKNPSLVVDPARQTFACFACGERGDVISFVQKVEKCSFHEAIGKLEVTEWPVKTAARKPTPASPPKKQPTSSPPDHNQLLPQLMLYMAGNGNLDLTDAYLTFEVGLAPHVLPARWKYLQGRLVFPIRDVEGRLVGFSGRLLNGSEGPKYLNTPASDGYNRNGVVYGLHRAKKAILRRAKVIITEGYKDCIALHAAGFTHSVAVCGTELSVSQATLLARFADDAILLLDGDAAGRRAAPKMKAILEEAGMQVSVAELPEGEDPDSLFTKMGPQAFRKFIAGCSEFSYPLECLLVTAGLLFPEATIQVKGEPFLLPELILGVLEQEELWLSKRTHRQLLARCAERAPI